MKLKTASSPLLCTHIPTCQCTFVAQFTKKQIKNSTHGDILMTSIQATQRWVSHPVKPGTDTLTRSDSQGQNTPTPWMNTANIKVAEDHRSCQSTFLFGFCFHRLQPRCCRSKHCALYFLGWIFMNAETRRDYCSFISSHILSTNSSQTQSFQALMT